MTRMKNGMIALILATVVAAGATMPSAAAQLASSAAAVRAAVSDGITRVQVSCYGCLGGRDHDGVPCNCR